MTQMTPLTLTRRGALVAIAALPLLPAATAAGAQEARIWSARQTFDALGDDAVRLLDIRSREEWIDSGVAEGAWPVSMHESGFPKRLFAARDLAGDRPVALICATGGRTGSVMHALKRAGYTGFVDVAEGMFGSRSGKGWIAEGLPLVPAEAALKAMPPELL